MSQPLFKLVALLLLMVQVILVPITGRVLCITTADASTLVAEHPTSCGSSHTGGCSRHSHPATPADPEPSSHDTEPSSHDACTCHSHVPVPSDERVPCGPRCDHSPARPSPEPLAINLILTCMCEPPAVAIITASSPDLSSSDRAGTLDSTRLLI